MKYALACALLIGGCAFDGDWTDYDGDAEFGSAQQEVMFPGDPPTGGQSHRKRRRDHEAGYGGETPRPPRKPPEVKPPPGDMPPNAAGGFTYEQVIPGRTTVLNPDWDTDDIIKNIDDIIEKDLKPVIYLPPGADPKTLEHEQIHATHSDTPEGRRRTGIALGDANLDPDYEPEARAYDTWTEMTAYRNDEHEQVKPVADQIQDWVHGGGFDPNNPDHVDILTQNTTAFITQLFPTVAHHYVDPETGRPVPPSPEVAKEAGKKLADLIIKYGLDNPNDGKK